MPLHVSHPAPDDLLPTTNLVWTKDSQTPTTTVQRHPASVSPSVPVGPFQRNCQCAILYTKALTGLSQAPLEDFSELDIATRALVEAMVWQASRWGDFYECFATCTWCVQCPSLPDQPLHLNTPRLDHQTDLLAFSSTSTAATSAPSTQRTFTSQPPTSTLSRPSPA